MTTLRTHKFRRCIALALVLLFSLAAAPSHAHAWGFPVLRFLGRAGLGIARGVGWLGVNAFRGVRWLLGGRFFGYPANGNAQPAFAYRSDTASDDLGSPRRSTTLAGRARGRESFAPSAALPGRAPIFEAATTAEALPTLAGSAGGF